MSSCFGTSVLEEQESVNLSKPKRLEPEPLLLLGSWVVLILLVLSDVFSLFSVTFANSISNSQLLATAGWTCKH